MAITPDTKDWTWVLSRPCPDCGLDSSLIERSDVATLIRANAEAWPGPLAAPDARQRPRPDVWSVLEYACHVRDVYELFDERLGLMLGSDDPQFANWNQDDTAVEKQYERDDPAAVATDLRSNAAQIAARFDTVTDDQWSRPGRRSDGAEFTVDTFARYLLHDVIHHVHDIGGEVPAH